MYVCVWQGWGGYAQKTLEQDLQNRRKARPGEENNLITYFSGVHEKFINNQLAITENRHNG